MPASESRIFLPRIPAGATDEVLRAHFARYGEITDCYIPMHPNTGKPKGMAFITFSSDESATAAIQTQHQINGESCEVHKAVPRPDRRGGGGPMRREQDVADPYLAGFLHAQSMMMGSGGGRERDAPRASQRSRIFIRDVPETFEDAVLQRYFEKFGEITDIYQPESKDGDSRKKKGIAYITFRSDEHLSACLAQGETHTVEGIDLSVTRADPRREKERPGMPSWSMYDAPYRSNSSAASTTRSQGNRIFVGGIPPELSSEQVAEHFRVHAGDLTDIYFPKDSRTGGTRGFCYVTFQENLAVHRAVANAPREIHGFKIGEIKVAEARPGDDGGGGGRGGMRGGGDYRGRGGDVDGYGIGRGNWGCDDGAGWGAGAMSMGYGSRNGEWSGGSSFGVGGSGLGDGMSLPRDNSSDLMERLAPLMSLLAAAGAAGAYGAGNQQPYGNGGGGGGWGHAGAQASAYGGQVAQRGHDNSLAGGRFRPY